MQAILLRETKVSVVATDAIIPRRRSGVKTIVCSQDCLCRGCSFSSVESIVFTPLLLHSLILLRSYYNYFCQSEIMQSSAKFCKVRRFSPLIMSEKRFFPFISGTRCRYQRGYFAYTNAARCACKRKNLTLNS